MPWVEFRSIIHPEKSEQLSTIIPRPFGTINSAPSAFLRFTFFPIRRNAETPRAQIK
jgi:hypothetical protein